MKKIIFPIAVASLLMVSCGEANDDTVKDDSTTAHEQSEGDNSVEEKIMIDGYAYYGIKEMNSEGAVSIEEMNAMVDSLGMFEGKVKAQLAGVCQKAGCWVTLVNPDGDDIRVFFGEHDFLVPIDTEIGKEVILEGKTDVDTFTVEFQKHLLDDEAASGNEVPQEAYDAITEDKVETSFIATGILIKP